MAYWGYTSTCCLALPLRVGGLDILMPATFNAFKVWQGNQLHNLCRDNWVIQGYYPKMENQMEAKKRKNTHTHMETGVSGIVRFAMLDA